MCYSFLSKHFNWEITPTTQNNHGEMRGRRNIDVFSERDQLKQMNWIVYGFCVPSLSLFSHHVFHGVDVSSSRLGESDSLLLPYNLWEASVEVIKIRNGGLGSIQLSCIFYKFINKLIFLSN